MPKDWETTFRNWSGPSSATEQEKMENAERQIRAAIRESTKLATKTIEVFPQGSYRNNTNVRQESDVDICVRCMDSFFFDFYFAKQVAYESAGIAEATYLYTEFKNDVEDALVSKFGRRRVNRGNKAFDIHENSTCVDADVVACFEHRRYSHINQYGHPQFISGTQFPADDGSRIINWPHQHNDNGVVKNNITGRRFKTMVRILKRLRNEMDANGITATGPIPSYLIECLVFNAPKGAFGHIQYVDDMRLILAHTIHGTSTDANCVEWGEVNDLKYLFRPTQPWTRIQAYQFLIAAWIYVGFS
jgi:hypothetical protein